MYFAEDINIDVIQLFNPVLPEKYISSLTYWTSANSEPASIFPLTGTPSLSADPNYYIVSVDGIVQRPDSYAINDTNKTLVLDNAAPANTTVNVVYMPLIQPPTNWIQTFNTETTAFVLTGSLNQQNYILDPHSSFLVNIGGVLQNPETYSFDIDNQRLVFNVTLPQSVPVSVTQLTVPDNINAVAAYTPAYVSLDKNYNTS